MMAEVSATTTTKLVHIDIQMDLPSPLLKPIRDPLLPELVKLLEDGSRASSRGLDRYFRFIDHFARLRHIAIINPVERLFNPSSPPATIPDRTAQIRRS